MDEHYMIAASKVQKERHEFGEFAKKEAEDYLNEIRKDFALSDDECSNLSICAEKNHPYMGKFTYNRQLKVFERVE